MYGSSTLNLQGKQLTSYNEITFDNYYRSTGLGETIDANNNGRKQNGALESIISVEWRIFVFILKIGKLI